MHRLVVITGIAVLATAALLSSGAAEVALGPVVKKPKVAAGSASAAKPEQVGASASELLRGNGTRAGYMLRHGNVLEGSEWISIGAHRARRNVDYTIDYASGSIFFTEPVPRSESVRVDYRYAESDTVDRALGGPGSMLLRFTDRSEAKLTYSYRTFGQASAGSGIDVLTYGANTRTRFGNSSLTSLMYVATPERQGRLTLGTVPSGKQTEPNAPKRDQLMVQNADLGLGDMRLRIGYQDVGESFAGFDALRDTSAVDKNVLNQLEKEKGIRRLDFASDVRLGDGGLSLAGGTISDKKGSIITQSYGYTGSRVKLGFSARDVDRQFSRFNDLKEADRAQIANEAGVTRKTFFFRFNTDSSANGANWSGFTNTTLSSEQGDLTYTSANLDVGALKLEADVRKADACFEELRALNDEERTSMALAAKRQFDARATQSVVDAQEKAQLQKEAGLDRQSYRAQYGIGPLWLSLTRSSVTDNNAGLSRTDYNIEHKAFKLHFARHHIDPDFKRLSSMQPTELKYFGNESGMTRTEADGEFKLGFGTVRVNHAHVSDQNGARVRRDSLDLKNRRLNFRADLQDIDPEFSRITDLCDADRNLMIKERGFSKSDYLIDFQAAPNLKVKSRFYDSTNSTAGQTRNQRLHEIAYMTGKNLKLTGIADDFSYVSEDGNISSYSRRKVTFDNTFQFMGGLLIKGSKDVNTTKEVDNQPVTTQVTQTHVETNPGGKTSYTLDTLQMELGPDHFEDTWALGFKAATSKQLALVGSFSRTARDEKPEANSSLGIDWQMKKDLKMSATVSNRDGGPRGSQQTHKFNLNGTVTNKLLWFEDIKVGSAVNTTQLAGKQTACDNGLKIEAKFLKGQFLLDNTDKLNPKNGIYYTSRVVRYESDNDPNRWYHLTYFRQNLITPTNEFARKRNYSAQIRLSRNLGMTASSYFGKDGQNGAVLPVGGGVFKLNCALPRNASVFADYSVDLNEATHRRARTTGIGFTGTLSNNAAVELYWGWSRLVEGPARDSDTVFRFKYDHKVSADHFITVVARKRSAVERSAINPYEGSITANLEFKTLFH